MRRAIPIIHLNRFTRGEPGERAETVNELGNAFRDTGFAGIVDHGIPQQLVSEYYIAARQFFALQDTVKQKYVVPGGAGQRGYTAFGQEHAKQSTVGDLKEFFQIGQEPGPGASGVPHYPDNVTVDEVPAFNKLGRELYREFENVGRELLRAIALYLDLDETYFEEWVIRGNSILRAIHYPPITSEPAGALRAEQHEDINLITLLVGASAGGLQILDRTGAWLPILPTENEIVVNVGDMLQRLTNDYLRSTTHRVVNPPRDEWHKPRLSIPFFLHPRKDMDLTCLASCVTPENPLKYEPITAGDYLDERLKEIGLKR